jgi:hypothetical protein
MYFTEDKYTIAMDLLAKLRGDEFGEKEENHYWYPVGPRWFADRREAFDLMVTCTEGYYETRRDTPDHCFVVGQKYGDAVVVRAIHHGSKAKALTYAIVLAAIANKRGRMQKMIDDIAAPAVYQQSVLRPGVTPRHNWLDWLNKRIETKTIYQGVYPEALAEELSKMPVRLLEPADVPGQAWDERWAKCWLRADGAVLHPRERDFEIGSLDDAGGITWILLPEPLLA